jgi:RHS repeat-associated protein
MLHYSLLFSGEYYYPIHDHLGSVRVVVDKNANVVEAFDYYPFGAELRSTVNDDQAANLRFTGKELDKESHIGLYYFGARYYDPEVGRFLGVDRFADKYPSMSPYQYAANNPLKFIDINGDSIQVSDAMAKNKVLAKYFASPEGYKYISQFAYEGQVVSIASQEFTFRKAGKFSSQNVNFIGIDTEIGANTVPTNSIDGEYFVGEEGVQSYNIFIGSGSTLSQADDIFHEVQHAFMYAAKGADGRGGLGSTVGSQGIHHRTMLTPALFNSHRSFLNSLGANSTFTRGIVSSLMAQAGITYTSKNLSKYVPEVQKIVSKRRNFMKQ